MITMEQYFGKFMDHPDAANTHKAAAEMLLVACAKLEEMAKADGIEFPINPFTKSGVSGSLYGGFRPQDCKIGAPKSSHKEAKAVDRYDPKKEIAAWSLANSGRDGKLAQCGIYLEHPNATIGWCHWTIKPPGSGRRVFFP